MMMNGSSDNTLHTNVPAVAWASSSSSPPPQQQPYFSSSVPSSGAPSSTALHVTVTTSTAAASNRHTSMVNSPFMNDNQTYGTGHLENDEMMDTGEDEETSTRCTATTVTATPCTSFDTIDTHASATTSSTTTATTTTNSGMCPLFMDGLPSNFNQNSQLAALASLLDDEVREEHVDGGDNNDDDQEDQEQDDGQDRHQSQTINVLPTIPEERTATTTSASIVITSPKVTGIKTYGRHDLVLQQRKWQRDQRILRSMKKNGGGKATTTAMMTTTKNSKTNSSSIKNKLISIQKGPRSMMKTSPSRKNSSKRLMSKHYRTTTSGSSHDATYSRSERMGYGDEKLRRRDCNTGDNANTTTTAAKGDGVSTMMASGVANNTNNNNNNTSSSSSSSSASSSKRLETSTTPSVGETTLFLNMWKL